MGASYIICIFSALVQRAPHIPLLLPLKPREEQSYVEKGKAWKLSPIYNCCEHAIYNYRRYYKVQMTCLTPTWVNSIAMAFIFIGLLTLRLVHVLKDNTQNMASLPNIIFGRLS